MRAPGRRVRKGPNCRVPTLKRLPRDFSWQLLRLVFGTLQDECSLGFRLHMDRVLNARDPGAYHDLGTQWGLQSKNSAGTECSRTLAAHLLLVSLMKKNPSLESVSAATRRSDCLKGILSNEEKMWRVQIPTDSVLSLAKAHALEVLGTAPDVNELYDSVKHGPGTTVGRVFEHTSSYFKYSEWPYLVSPLARPMLQAAILRDPRWLGALEDSYRRRFDIPAWRVLDWTTFWQNAIQSCPYNKIAVVPKDGTKDRPIAIEPGGNVLLQLGVDRMMRRRMRDSGLDLNDQAPNQRLAQRGCVDGSLDPVTLDLSNASDTVARTLVQALLPARWFELLDSIRSPYGVLPDGTALRYAKMSSMGNGSTFVLESLVFWSLIVAISQRFGHVSDLVSVRAYGDDLTCPKYLAQHLVLYLNAWGFQVNHKKSFLSGPLRESCGKDYWRGIDVRGVFLKEDPQDVGALLGIRNRLHRWFVRHTGCSIPLDVDSFFESYIVDGYTDVPVGPENDDEFDTFLHSVQTHRMREFVRVRAIGARPRELPAREFLFRKLMHDLAQVEVAQSGRFLVTVRGRGTLCRSDRVLYRGFYSLDGALQDHARPRYGGLTTTPSR